MFLRHYDEVKTLLGKQPTWCPKSADLRPSTRIPDHCVDLVISVFGAMFAPLAFDFAHEMVRVTRPGNRIMMGNGSPGNPVLVAQLLKTSADLTPPPPEDFVGLDMEVTVPKRFGAAGIPAHNIRCDPANLVLRANKPPADDLRRDLAALFAAQNQGESDRTVIRATYLRVIVHKPVGIGA